MDKFYILLCFWISYAVICEAATFDGRVGIITPNQYETMVGSEIVLMCIVNTTFNCKKEQETDRGFTFEFKNKTRVPNDYIRPINSSAIELRIPNAQLMTERFKCYCNHNAIDYAYVRVGTPPQNVTDFDCVGYNFEYLTCSFSEPMNHVEETYTLEYSVSHEQYVLDAGLIKDTNINKYVCNITGQAYFAVHEHYNFTLKINSSLGVWSQKFNINQIDRMIPATPNLTLINTSHNSLTFKWTYNRATLFKDPKGYSLLFEVKYLPELNKEKNNDDDFILYNVTIPDSKNNNNYTIKLENLEYAYTWYDIRVRLRVKSPKVKETPWSETFNITSKTDSRPPDNPPKTDVGSFYIDDSNFKVHLYWETLPSYKQNGKDTRYIVKNVLVNGVETSIQPISVKLNTATFQYNATNRYEFHIKSINEVDECANYSIISIPMRKRFQKDYFIPKFFNKIFHNNTYELTWDEPKTVSYILRDYTVFWCKSNQESHTECENSDDGSIHFEHVPKNRRYFTKSKKNQHLNFGVSANFDGLSSGIVWASCTGLKTGDFEEVQVLSQSGTTAHTIIISWNLDCVHNTILKGYNLTYCPYTEIINELSQGTEPNCTEPEKFVIIPKGKAPGEYKLTNLKPYKSYKINIHMFSEEKAGPKLSKPVYATTMEAAPSMPRNLKILNKTSNYATIQWDVPENKNGDIRYYEIIYNDDKKKLEKANFPENSSTTITYRLEHLKSYHNYKVFVTAFTVTNSNRSNDITFTTWMGQPDSLKPGRSGSDNGSTKVVLWDAPVDPAANKTSFYKIVINSKHGDRKAFQVISFVQKRRCTLRPVCKSVEIQTEIKGTAVNAIPKDEFDYRRFEHITFSPCNNAVNQTSSYAENTEISSLNQFTDDEAFDERDFICEEDIRHNNEQFGNVYCGSREYKFLAGNDEVIYSFECNLGKKELTQTLILWLGTILCISMVAAVSYFGVKKIKKMKNIDIVLPPGLNDLNQLDTNKGNQDKPSVERQNIEKANEISHLLSSIDNGSNGYLNCSGSEKSYDVNCSNDVICNNDDGHSLTQSGNSEEISDMSNRYINSSGSESPNLSDLQSRKEMNFMLPSGYTNHSGLMPTSEGYVQQSVLQKHSPPPPVGSGYTALETLTKPTIITNPMPTPSIDNYVNPSSIGLVSKPKIFLTSTTNPNNPTLAGYVTHKQLSDYGQQKRH